MGHLIIGDTTERSVRLWLRGSERERRCVATLTRVRATARAAHGNHAGDTPDRHDDRRGPDADPAPKTLVFAEPTDYTGTLTFSGLCADTEYRISVRFDDSTNEVPGRVRTFPCRPSATAPPVSFSFVLSSCNLSVVSINNFLAMLLAIFGTSLGNSSLSLPFERWRWPDAWLRPLLRPLLSVGLKIVAGAIKHATNIKQPGVPYLRSPFLKLSAVFDAYILDIVVGENAVPAVGATVVTTGRARGVVACTATVLARAPREGDHIDAVPVTSSDPKLQPGQILCRLVVTHVDVPFAPGDRLRRVLEDPDSGLPIGEVEAGDVRCCQAAEPWHERPSFFMHAGDQIYFDFPDPVRVPTLDEYRLAYREAWFEDHANRHLLSHWPHYMTLDDHEIADQFALDFTPPENRAGANADAYARAAVTAYREYARQLVPEPPGDVVPSPAKPDAGPRLWYSFTRDGAAFFVLDTRTSRQDDRTKHPAQILDERQLRELLTWLSAPENKDRLKFVVTSVPFVAEINDDETDSIPRWGDKEMTTVKKIESMKATTPTSSDSRNAENDKWSASRFRGQREAIIEHIAVERIERVVFLTGDMHCCYHASMRIEPAVRGDNDQVGPAPRAPGEAMKYRSITVHELAGGPVNQLQLADPMEFNRRATRETRNRISFDIDLDRFHGDVSAVMHIGVRWDERLDPRAGAIHSPVIEWRVIRTLTDSGADAWRPAAAPVSVPRGGGAARPVDDSMRPHEPVMSGQITFTPARQVADLRPWVPAGLWTTR